MPTIGERKSKNGITGEWDGQTWRHVSGDSASAAPADDGFKINPGEDALSSTMRYAGDELKGLAHAPGDALSGLLHAPGQVVKGWLHDIPTAIKETVAPSYGQDSLIKSVPGAVGDAVKDIAMHPDALGSLLGQAVIGKVAGPRIGPAAETAVRNGPALAGRAIEATGRGMEAVGSSPVLKSPVSMMARGVGAAMHPSVGTVAAAAAPELLEYGGRGVQKLGRGVKGVDLSPVLEGLKNVGNTDVGQFVKDAVTPQVVEDPAVTSVRSTVDTARGHVAKGQSREQAAQRAGWPLGESSAAPHTTPGADVRSQWPYKPAVRGVGGSPISEGRNSPLDGLQKATQPSVYAKELLDQPGSQTFMNNEHAANTGVADDALGKNRSFIDLNDAEQAKQAYLDAIGEDHGPEVDITHELAGLSNLDRASRLARARSAARAGGANTPFAEGY